MEQIFIACIMGIVVSVDNFIISLSFGLVLPKIKSKTILKTAAFFAFFTLLFYLIGMEIGIYLEKFLEHDHYFASAFLIFIGLKMIKSSFSKRKPDVKPETLLNYKMLLLFSIAASVDALVIGLSAELSHISTVYPAVAMTLFVFLATFSGLKAGRQLSSEKVKTMQIIGGAILVLLGIKVLISG